MSDKKLPLYLTTKEFKEHVVNWSDDTIYRRVHEDNMPAVKDGTRYLFPTKEVIEWFKRRTVKAG